jgi:rod shape-determining protein MreC
MGLGRFDHRRVRRSRIGLDQFEDRYGAQRRSARGTLIVLVLACASLITLDYRGGADSPLEPVRSAVGEAFGPVESATAGAVRPFAAIPDWFHTQAGLRRDVAALQAQNSELREQLATTDLDRNRLAEYDALAGAARDTGYTVVPAHVIAMGPSQAFSRTVTLDAGVDDGIITDQTVLNNDGLVGRVIRTTSHTATVLLIVDADSTVGGRIGANLQVGFVNGQGKLGNDGNLYLDLVDDSLVPSRDDVVVTWGSQGGAPYVAGIPIGRVTSVVNLPRETSQRAVIEPFVDFGALDLVGVVVPDGTRTDRSLEAAR